MLKNTLFELRYVQTLVTKVSLLIIIHKNNNENNNGHVIMIMIKIITIKYISKNTPTSNIVFLAF